MFSKLFQLFSLKRKFSSTENPNAEGRDRPTKRVRIEQPSSIPEEFAQYTPVQDACTPEDDEEEEELEVCDEILPRGTKGKEAERVEELEEEVRETRAIAARLREETRNYVESIDRAMNCVVCYDFIRNPQVLSECGHTVCYQCLRTWFTRDTEDYNAAPMVSTDEESDGDDDSRQPSSSNVTPPPRRRRRFHCAVNRKKVCPECSNIITRRPIPLFRLRHLADVLNGAEAPVPSIIQPRGKLHKLSKREDIWRGIFHAQGDNKNGADPLLEHWVQAQVHRDAHRERLRWQAAMDEAREEGRRQMMQELRREREELNEERRRQPFNPFDRRAQDEPMGVVERRIRALPSRRAFPAPAPIHNTLPYPSLQPGFIPASEQEPSSSTHLPPSFPGIPLPRQPSPEFVSGPDALPPPVFLPPPPPEAGPSNSNRSPPPPPPPYSPTSPRIPSSTSNSRNSTPTILESLRHLRQHLHSTPSDDVDELGDDDETESGDEDFPLTPVPQYHREYPVYVEELNLEEDRLPQPDDQPQVMDVDIPVIIYLDEDEDDEESPEERLRRLVREGEDEGGVDLE